MSEHKHKLEYAGGAGIALVPSEDVCRQVRTECGLMLGVMQSPLEVWECDCGYWEHRKTPEVEAQ